jgi:predicted RNA-binding protein with TRAM domain
MEQKILKKNDELEVDILRLGANGEGVAVHEGIVIFVPHALVGERVLVHIINDKNSFLKQLFLKLFALPTGKRHIYPVVLTNILNALRELMYIYIY